MTNKEMTNEEAIRIATGLRTDFKCKSDTMVDFCNTVIKALEQTPRKDEIILTKKEYGELVSSEFDNGYAKGYREALEQQPIAEERYQDLVEYFGDKDIAKRILEDREEFKKWLERFKWHVRKVDELARKLEQEPSEDAVSRQAVLAIAGDSCLDLNYYEDTKEFCDEIKELPPVTPKGVTNTDFGWIPCSERMPELDVNINVCSKKNPIMVSKPVYISYKLDGCDYVCPIPCILHSNGYWYNDSDSLEDWVNLDDYDSWIDSPLSNLEVTAWQPLPKPYKAESEV